MARNLIRFFFTSAVMSDALREAGKLEMGRILVECEATKQRSQAGSAAKSAGRTGRTQEGSGRWIIPTGACMGGGGVEVVVQA
jgi:hypothetical protein